MVARASHRSKLAVCAPPSSASRSTVEWKRWTRRRYMWLGLVPRARCDPQRGNARQVATDAHRGGASPAKTVFIFVAHLPQYNNCAQPDQNLGDENHRIFFGPVYLPISLTCEQQEKNIKTENMLRGAYTSATTMAPTCEEARIARIGRCATHSFTLGVRSKP